MLGRAKQRLRNRVRAFLGTDRIGELEARLDRLETHDALRQIEALSRRLDALERLGGRLDRLEPIVFTLEEAYYLERGELRPRRDRIFVGGIDDFSTIGEKFVEHFKNLCGLRSDEKVLDIGSGIGRIAIPLTRYLGNTGEYAGFDIVKDGVDWCRQNITARHPRFQFQWVDVYNPQYNPSGTVPAREFRFPYADGSFDFAFLISVFTHMLPADMETYSSETARVLKPGGRCLSTFFLWNEESSRLVAAGRGDFDFKYHEGPCHFLDHNLRESAVAYDEAFVLRTYDRCGLSVQSPIHYGQWCDRTTYLDGLDIIVATK